MTIRVSVASCICALALALPAARALRASATGVIPPIDAHTSLLVVSPHPDDETLCCAGVIQRVVAAGGRANVVWLTSGDASELDMFVIERALLLRPDRMRDLAARRMREARAAAAVLGVPPTHNSFSAIRTKGS